MNAEIKVKSTNWHDDSGEIQMHADNIKYSVTAGDYNSKVILYTDHKIDRIFGRERTIIPELKPQINTDTFWQLETKILRFNIIWGFSTTL